MANLKKGQPITDISILIAGKAGDGVLFTGNVLAKILKRQGFEVVTCRDFPSNIRGEATSYIVRASLDRIYGWGDCVELLLAFDCQAVFKNVQTMAPGGVVFCDGEGVGAMPDQLKKGKTFHRFLLRQLAKETFGQEVYKNMIALGALSYVLDLDTQIIQEIITEMFLKKKGQEIVDKNTQALMLGWGKAQEMISDSECHALEKAKDQGRIVISGDEAIALGALAAGCRFFAAYPICPASEIWQWLAIYLPEFNGAVVQTEDELAAMNMAVGAAYAGARAMTSTSGPGASLMMEALSLAGMAEVPVVVAHVQRVGPATGTPTKTEQSDITQWIFGSHGDFPRIVLAPGTIEECFDLTVKAFNLSERYQCPVILMTELDMGQNFRTAREFHFDKIGIDRGRLLSQDDLLGMDDFKRYEFTADGISPRALPGMKNGLHMVEGNEHNEKGYRDEDPDMRRRMMDKRMKKLDAAAKDLIASKVWGEPKADIGIIATGSTLGAIVEAQGQLAQKGIRTKFLQLRTLWPFPVKETQAFLDGCRQVFVVENNFSGQLSRLVKSQVEGCPRFKNILKYSSLPFKPMDISRRILRALR
jgi:2-oxoglutarate/2-oxoacid ferredoxin oxidoreductase subunit alpha